MSKVIDLIKNKVEEVASTSGYEVVDFEYVKQYGQMNLTIFIYKESGIGLEDCETFHKIIDPVLDELDPTSGEAYVLNISSPGLDRPLKTDADFKRHLGKEVEIGLYAQVEKSKKHNGILVDFNDEFISINTNKNELKIKKTDIAVVKPAIKF